jgi:hypothetical protein
VATWLWSDQPFSAGELVGSVIGGGIGGAVGGALFKGAGIGLKAVAGWVSDALSDTAGQEAGAAAETVVNCTTKDGCFVAGTTVLTARGDHGTRIRGHSYFLTRIRGHSYFLTPSRPFGSFLPCQESDGSHRAGWCTTC